MYIVIYPSLENKLKAYSVVAKKDRIHIEHLGKEYIVDIVDTQPRNIVDIIETDVEVDIEYAEEYVVVFFEIISCIAPRNKPFYPRNPRNPRNLRKIN